MTDCTHPTRSTLVNPMNGYAAVYCNNCQANLTYPNDPPANAPGNLAKSNEEFQESEDQAFDS